MQHDKKNESEKIGIILMTYGSPASLDDIPIFLKNVYGGKDMSEEVIKEFSRRYDLIGGSPLISITQRQAEQNDIQFFRTESLNTSPLFIKALAQVVDKTLNLNR